MNSLLKCTVKLGLCALVAAAAPLGAQAETLKFRLSQETKCNGIALAPGEYSLRIPEYGDASRNLLVVSGAGKSVAVIARPETDQRISNGQYLTILSAPGDRAITELVLGSLGRTYHFNVPQSIRTEMAKNKREQTVIAVKRQTNSTHALKGAL